MKPIKKIVYVIVESTCDDCPYCVYNSYYSRSEDSGFDCEHPDAAYTRRIVDDNTLSEYKEEIEKLEGSKQTLFPVNKDLKNPMSIPDWCPLKDFDPKEPK